MNKLKFASYLMRIIMLFFIGSIVVNAWKSIGMSIPAHTVNYADAVSVVSVIVFLVFVGYAAGADTLDYTAEDLGIKE